MYLLRIHHILFEYKVMQCIYIYICVHIYIYTYIYTHHRRSESYFRALQGRSSYREDGRAL